MGLKFKGPRYDPLAVALRQVTRGGHRQAVAAAMRTAIAELIDDRFGARAAPDENPWAPRKRPTGNWPLLEKTGAMRAGFSIDARTTGVSISNTQDYLKFHQTGTRKMVARPVLPRGPLPEWWRQYIDLAVSEAIRAYIEGQL